jgi:hypothetical protein
MLHHMAEVTEKINEKRPQRTRTPVAITDRPRTNVILSHIQYQPPPVKLKVLLVDFTPGLLHNPIVQASTELNVPQHWRKVSLRKNRQARSQRRNIKWQSVTANKKDNGC